VRGKEFTSPEAGLNVVTIQSVPLGERTDPWAV